MNKRDILKTICGQLHSKKKNAMLDKITFERMLETFADGDRALIGLPSVMLYIQY